MLCLFLMKSKERYNFVAEDQMNTVTLSGGWNKANPVVEWV